MYRAIDIAGYIIEYSNEKGQPVSNLKLQKLLYFVQAFFLITKGKPCFRDKIEAWDFGPVIPEVYRAYKHYGGCSIFRVRSFPNTFSLFPQDKEIINEVVDYFSSYSSTQLVELTQHQRPWMDAYVSHLRKEITCSAIQEYFCSSTAV